MKRVKKGLCLYLCVSILLLLFSFVFTAEQVSAYENIGISATDLTETAKAEIGNTSSGKTKYCQWIAEPNAQSAASFLAWCAYRAGINEAVIPRISDNSDMLSYFKTNKLFSASAYLKGKEKPEVGSIIFIGSVAGDIDSLTRIGIVTGISGMTVSFVEDGYEDRVSQGKCSIYNTFILGYAFPDYTHVKEYEAGVYQTTAAMNFRTGPDTTYPIVKNSSGNTIAIPSATTITVTEINGSWGYLKYMEMPGWIKLDWSTYIGAVYEPSDEEWLIVDVSQFQPEAAIDWDSIKSAGVRGAIIRIGGRYYGSSSNHLIYDDEEFSLHYAGAKKAGLSIGTYFFSAAYTQERATEEAKFVLDELKKGDYVLDLPVFIDIEDINDNYKPHYAAGKQVCTLVTDTFCDVIESAGYYAGIYCSKDFAEVLLEPTVFNDRAVWIAQYNDECTYNGKYHMWQYTKSAKISGYNGPLDMSKCYYDIPAFIRSEGYNGFLATGENAEENWIISVESTCKAEGTEVISDDDGKEIVKRIIPRLSHNLVQAVVIGQEVIAGDKITTESDYALINYSSYIDSQAMQSEFSTQGGTILEYCSYCSKIIETEYSSSNSCTHANVQEKTEQESTCSAEGLLVTFCSDCNSNISSKLLPLAEHSPVQTVQAATCIQEGTSATKCSECGLLIYYRNNGFAEHIGDWKVVTPARGLVAGSQTCLCTVCDKNVTQEISPLMMCDLDYDRAISSADARLALRISVELETADEVLFSVADIDNDAVITASDARIILRMCVRLENYKDVIKQYYKIEIT